MISNPAFTNTKTLISTSAVPIRHCDLHEVNCVNSKGIYHYIRRHKPEKLKDLFVNLPEPYNDIKNIEAFLTDENNWVTSELITALFNNAVRIFQDPSVPFHIGIETITSRNIGVLLNFFLTTFSSPKTILKRLNQINQQFNTTKIIETVYLSKKRTVIRLHWKDGRILDKNVCLYNQGVYAAIPTIWGMSPQEVIETDCYFDGAPYCQYNIKFQRRKLFSFVIKHQIKTKKAKLLLAIEEIESDKLLLKKKNEEVVKLNNELREKVDRLKAINEASRLLVSMGDTDEILKTTMNIIVKVLKFDRALLMLIDKDKEYLEYVHATGVKQDEINKKLKGYRIPLTKTNNILIKTTIDGKPILIRNTEKAGLNPDNLIIKEFQPTSIAFCPLLTSKGAIGILAADRTISNNLIAQKELEHLSIFVNNLAATLYKTQQDEEIKRGYLNTVKALVKAIEEKDLYTRGHSERVSKLAIKIAEEMNLPKEEADFIGIGSLLHDVGKIGIPESIVKSPKKLTAAEFKIIRMHPEKGCEIINPIRRLKAHAYLIRSHHERYDGKGYPDGLAGDEIPLGAQIISIADTFDAITSSRAYRKGLHKNEAVRRISEAEGSQFSPEVTRAFIGVFEKEIKDDDHYLEHSE
ncbi:MAG: HD domain-containing protein [Spirochaetales bacterium]|nr:HD domain-containing protein [Spirochaetales bacterium]